jgi:pimeloyl-ACP methyl ester carboxylesterase
MSERRPPEGSVAPAKRSVEKVRTQINGVQQGMFITGIGPDKPVLLFLHGGPGMPTYFLNRRYPTGMENDFIVCWWEQGGAGLSYHPDMRPEELTIEQLLADAAEVVHYLRDRFGQDKVYLMGHSWGSFLGIQVAARAPDLFHAYIGVAQVSYQLRSENVAYTYMLEQYRAIGDRRMARRLEAAPPSMTPPLPPAYDRLRDEAMHRLGVGTTHDMKSVLTGVFVPTWTGPDYTLAEKMNLWRGKFRSKSILWQQMLATDLTARIIELAVPTYFCHGTHDYTVCYAETKAYFEKLKAPLKGFYTFPESAHCPMHEEPARMQRILRADVLAGTIHLADHA